MEFSLLSARNLCVKLESVAPEYGAHVALTGGCLYKDGGRKDIDIVIYRIRQVPAINIDGLLKAFAGQGLYVVESFGTWLVKCKWGEKNVDLLFPEGNGVEGYGKIESTLPNVLIDMDDLGI